MATVALSMHSKQPKRAMISCETGYIEIMEFPRADRAVFVDAETGKRTEITCGESRQALYYEMTDMEDDRAKRRCFRNAAAVFQGRHGHHDQTAKGLEAAISKGTVVNKKAQPFSVNGWALCCQRRETISTEDLMLSTQKSSYVYNG